MFIYKYYSDVKIIHKVVLDILGSSFGKSLFVNSIFEQMSIVGDNSMVRLPQGFPATNRAVSKLSDHKGFLSQS